MVCNRNPGEWLKAMADEEAEGSRTPAQLPDLVYFHGVIVTRETAAEAQRDLEVA